MIDWSVTNLPLPSALSVTNRSAALRKKAESGRYLQRRRFTTSFEEGTVQFKFLNEQFQIFKGVWVHYLNNGTTSFTIDLPVGGNTTLTNCEVKFVNDYSYQYVSVDYVTVQCKIEFKEVTAPDKLALDNLINVGDIYLQREVETVEITWANIYQVQNSAGAIRPTINNKDYSVTQIIQWWDGTSQLITNSPSLKYLPVTINTEYFVTHHYPTVSITDPTGDPNKIFNKISFFGLANLWSWDPYKTSNYPWVSLDFVNNPNYTMPYPNNTFKLIMQPEHQLLRMTNMEKMVNLKIELTDNVFSQGNQYPFDINNCDLLNAITTTASPSNIKASLDRILITSCPNFSGHLDLSEYVFNTDNIDTSTFPYVRIIANPVLTSLTINGAPQAGRYGRGRYFFNDNNLNTITISGTNPIWFYGNNMNLTSNNLDILALKAIVDKVKGHPDGAVTFNTAKISGNPCWQNNEIYPKAFDNPISISGITSTATDFEVTTGSSHNLVAGQWIKIQSSSNNAYNRIWQVNTITASDAFTVLSSTNAGAASGGTVKTEADSDSFYVEITAWQNNFSWIA